VNVHKNARLTIEGRKLLVERIPEIGLRAAAEAAGVSLRTAKKWLRRCQEHGLEGLADRSSRPRRTRSTVDEALERSIEQLRRLRMPMRGIAERVGRSVSTVSRRLARLGLSSLKALDPVRPVVRYEHTAPGEMLHMDTKKLGRIVRPSHRVTGNRRDSVEGAGWEFAHRAGPAKLNSPMRVDTAPKGEGIARENWSKHEQETAPHALSGIQGQGGPGGSARRQDAG
jgi:transposase-like protein